MISVLYVNHAHSEICGVHDLGRRHARLIARGEGILLDYVEINDIVSYHAALKEHDYNVVVINFMPSIMPWVTESIKQHQAKRIAVIHNYQHDTIDQVAAQHHRLFDYVLALDPSLNVPNDRVLTTNRPLPDTVPLHQLPDPPQIGSFGFAFPHKNFPAVAAEIAATFDEAVLDLHMPEAYFNGAQGDLLYTEGILAECSQHLATKPGLKLNYTSGHYKPEELVARLAGNTVNCLFYVPGQHNAGLSSALDYLVAARRPILVTDCAMFAHYHHACAHFPETRLRDVVDDHRFWSQQVDMAYVEAAALVTEQTVEHLRRIA